MKRMLVDNSGKMEVDNKLGEGATFRVFFQNIYEGEK